MGFCFHDIEKIKELEIEIGRMLPLVNPILMLRMSDHKVAAHCSEVAALHGACNASEAQGELAHQAIKRAARSKNKVLLQDGRIQHDILVSVACSMQSI